MHYTFVDQSILTFCNGWLPGQLFSVKKLQLTPKMGQIGVKYNEHIISTKNLASQPIIAKYIMLNG